MDALCEELDRAKDEIENLKEQCRAKAELAESLRRAHNDQLSKDKETSSKLEKLTHELTEKDGEFFAVKQMYEELKSSSTQKESIIKNLTCLNEKLRSDFTEKLRKCEEENKALASALDDSNAKNTDQEKLIRGLKDEIEGVKKLLAFSEKKCLKAENNTEASKELKVREDGFLILQEEKRKLEDELKWKKEQFCHLEEAHEKLRNQLRTREIEWENKEAMALALDNANSKNFDQEQQICALEHEIEGFKKIQFFSEDESENKTKGLKGRDENAFLKLEEEKKKFEDQLKWKKEQFVHLEEAHEKLWSQLKTKEKEWEKEKVSLLDGISSLQTKLESQTRILHDLQSRFEMCNQALAHAEGKRKLLEAQLSESKTSFDSICAEYDVAKSNFESFNAKRDQEIASLRSSLSTKDILYKEMEYQFKKVDQEKQECLVLVKELQEAQIREAGFSSCSKLQSKIKFLERAHMGCSTNLREKESELEKLSEELSVCRSALKNRDNSLNELKKELEACDSVILNLELINQETSLALLVLKSEFSENIYELVEKLEQKKVALSLVQQDLEGEREKVSILLRKVEALEQVQVPLQKEVNRLEEMLKESTKSQLMSEEQVLQIQSDLRKVNNALDRANEELYERFCEANEIEFELMMWKSSAEKLEENLEQNLLMRREVEASLIAQVEVEVNLKQEIEENEKRINDLQQKLLEEKDERIYDLQKLVGTLEEEFENSSNSFSCRLSQVQKESILFRESWEKIKTNAVLNEVEIQEKNLVIVELENDLLQQERKARLDNNEKKIREIKEVEELEKRNEKLVSSLSWISKRMEQLSVEDFKLTESLGNIVNAIDEEKDEESVKENVNSMNVMMSSSSPLMKKVEAKCDERSPLRALTVNTVGKI
ncbi:hypothetical protein ABFS83_11G100300 [Erythranthe nasuta]